MAHWVMIEMAKLSKEKRARVERLLGQGLCCRCETRKEVARWECTVCLNELYNIKKFGDPIKAAKFEARLIREGKLGPTYDKTFTKIKVKRIKPAPSVVVDPVKSAS